MTEENDIDGVRISNYIHPVVNPEGSVFEPVTVPNITVETSSDGVKTWIDVDSTWNPEICSLDEHRQKEFAKIKQSGFGNNGKVKSDG